MTDNATPRDDNLRLVLSKGHDEWLIKERVRTSKEIKNALVLACVCAAWFVFVGFQWTAELDRAAAEEPCYIIQESLIPDETLPKEMRENQCAIGTDTITKDDEASGAFFLIAGFALTILALITLPISVHGWVNGVRRLRDIDTWTQDHQAFLRKYGRR